MHGQHFRHAHATKPGVAGQSHPTAFDVGCVSLFETDGGGDPALVPLRAFFVTTAIEGRNQVRGDFGRLLENGVCRIGVDAVGQGRQARPHGRSIEHFVQHKAHVAQRDFEFGHNVNLVGTVVSWAGHSRIRPARTRSSRSNTCCQMDAMSDRVRAPWPARATHTSGSCLWKSLARA
ncbi:hypothetical protein D3C81_1621170 [compost metagenome]